MDYEGLVGGCKCVLNLELLPTFPMKFLWQLCFPNCIWKYLFPPLEWWKGQILTYSLYNFWSCTFVYASPFYGFSLSCVICSYCISFPCPAIWLLFPAHFTLSVSHEHLFLLTLCFCLYVTFVWKVISPFLCSINFYSCLRIHMKCWFFKGIFSWFGKFW
jgi:hypothetical protein